MASIYFVSDLHGKTGRYEMLFEQIKASPPDLVLIGGDNLQTNNPSVFFETTILHGLRGLKNALGSQYPAFLIIPGNDDPAVFDELFRSAESEGLLHFIVESEFKYMNLTFIGYPFVPPTPFLLKDREKYDVSRFVDPGCLPPDVGKRTVIPNYDLEFSTIAKDLDTFSHLNMDSSIFLFHCPPYQTSLDRAALDGHSFDHVPLDVHIGSIAIQRFIEKYQPLITLHGHVHESSRLTGEWKIQIGKTYCMSAASDQEGLTIVIIDSDNPNMAERKIFLKG